MQAAFGHRKCVVHDERARCAAGSGVREARLERLPRADHAAAARARPPGRPPPGGEVSRAVGAATLAAFRREQPFGWQEEAVRQLAEMDARYDRVLAARDFASPPDDPGCACRLYMHDGLGQVDEVGTLMSRRRRGHARAAVAAAADAATADGCERRLHRHRRVGLAAGAVQEPRLRRDRRHVRVPQGADYEPYIIVSVELLPCIVQDARTGEVLTLAYMNEEALERTRATGEMWFWSRSRQELWHKGETSGNVQKLKELRLDCDEDALLALVEPAGPACHTGERTCFHKGELDPVGGRGPGHARAHDRRPPRGPARGELHGDPAGRPRAGRQEGPGGGRGGRPRGARGDRRARRGGGGRRALPPGRAAGRARDGAQRRVRGAEWPSPLTSS